jgi:hypothetical protein
VGAREGGSVNHSDWPALVLEALLASENRNNSVDAVFDSKRVTYMLATQAQRLQDEIGGFRPVGQNLCCEVHR